ncbi:type VI secretion system lipoprotein TssJ [Vibrio japonicus]|uniref:Type VI secretion system lipoprotein TssJ n=1 Tax=Vibrio japonicus TaxID=1824638 RepID=A0ABY5LNP7_9VIBR|nr:type VI secretion system lipoprotein TssJ [Vibrio japonicus]UUM32468.1 type VI secretion system lipoprotein TssJ [Vibrio japonicus]
MRKVVLLIGFALLSGCTMWDQFKETTGITPETSSIELLIEASPVLNERVGGQSSPVVLRVHELSSPVLFRRLDFFALFESDKASLGDEYIKRYEYEIQPGESVEQLLTLAPATRALGFSVAFRDIDGSSWRKVVEIEAKSKYVMKLNLEGSDLMTDEDGGLEQVYF